MRKMLKRSFSLAMIVLLLSINLNVQASDGTDDFQDVPSNQINIKMRSEEVSRIRSEPSLSVCDLGIGISPNGVGVVYTTRSTTIATEIGCKDMVLQEKTALGWKDIPIRDHYEYDTDIYAGSVVYLKAVAGKTYRVYCTHYAIIDGVEYALYNITDSIVYN